jgi:hypothetical protein
VHFQTTPTQRRKKVATTGAKPAVHQTHLEPRRRRAALGVERHRLPRDGGDALYDALLGAHGAHADYDVAFWGWGWGGEGRRLRVRECFEVLGGARGTSNRCFGTTALTVPAAGWFSQLPRAEKCRRGSPTRTRSCTPGSASAITMFHPRPLKVGNMLGPFT